MIAAATWSTRSFRFFQPPSHFADALVARERGAGVDAEDVAAVAGYSD